MQFALYVLGHNTIRDSGSSEITSNHLAVWWHYCPLSLWIGSAHNMANPSKITCKQRGGGQGEGVGAGLGLSLCFSSSLPWHCQRAVCHPDCCPPRSPTGSGSDTTQDPLTESTCLQNRYEENYTLDEVKFNEWMSNSAHLVPIANSVCTVRCLHLSLNFRKTNLGGLCLRLLTVRRRYGSFSLRDSGEPHGS